MDNDGEDQRLIEGAFSPPVDACKVKELEERVSGDLYFLETMDMTRLNKDQALGFERALSQLRGSMETMIHHMRTVAKEHNIANTFMQILKDTTRKVVSKEREQSLQKVQYAIKAVGERLETSIKEIKDMKPSSAGSVDVGAIAEATASKVTELAEPMNTIIQDIKKTIIETKDRGSTSTYAQATANPWKTIEPRRKKIQISSGQDVTISETEDILIKPQEGHENEYADAEAVMKKLKTTVNPDDLDITVMKMIPRRNMVVVIVRKGDGRKLLESQTIRRAGLTVEARRKLQPRIAVRDIPGDMMEDELQERLKKAIPHEQLREKLKIIKMVPNRAGTQTAIAEIPAEAHEELTQRGRIKIGWTMCRISTDIKANQCYNCQSFGHHAARCASTAVCGKCAGKHETRACKAKGGKKCVNCMDEHRKDHNHSAFDTTKCPILRAELERSARNTEYS